GDHAEESAAGDAHNKAPSIGLYLAIKPTVGPPADADHLQQRGLGWCGLRFTHGTGAAGTDSSDSIASITDCVEIWFIGTAPCVGLNWLTGPWDSPRRTRADWERGCQWKGLVGPNRTTWGISHAAAKCIGAESTVMSKRALRTIAARVSKSVLPERSITSERVEDLIVAI